MQTKEIISSIRRLRLGEEKKERKKKERSNYRAKYDGLPYSIGQP